MNFPHNLEFIEQKYHKNIKQIEEIYNKRPIIPINHIFIFIYIIS